MDSELHLNEPSTAWLRTAIGSDSRILRAERFICGPASPVFRIDTSGGPFVFRLYVDTEWRREEPDLVHHEAAVLRLAYEHGLPCPTVVATTDDTEPFGYPGLLMTHLDGRVDVTPTDTDAWLDQLADTLVDIHSIPVPEIPWRHRREVDPEKLEVPSWTSRPELWRKAIDLLAADPQPADDVFLHGDFHPVNILWRDGSLCGIVDWPNACLGPSAHDVAHCCTNLTAMRGPELAEEFRRRYEAASGGLDPYDPIWDLESIYMWAATPKPGFYPPWVDYGLPHPGEAALFDRFDTYLRVVLDRI